MSPGAGTEEARSRRELSTGSWKAVLLITLDVGNKLFIVHFWMGGAEVKKIFKNRSVVMLKCLKIKERAGNQWQQGAE
jgi:hypothetical protein